MEGINMAAAVGVLVEPLKKINMGEVVLEGGISMAAVEDSEEETSMGVVEDLEGGANTVVLEEEVSEVEINMVGEEVEVNLEVAMTISMVEDLVVEMINLETTSTEVAEDLAEVINMVVVVVVEVEDLAETVVERNLIWVSWIRSTV
jgi:hypothetical protein